MKVSRDNPFSMYAKDSKLFLHAHVLYGWSPMKVADNESTTVLYNNTTPIHPTPQQNL